MHPADTRLSIAILDRNPCLSVGLATLLQEEGRVVAHPVPVSAQLKVDVPPPRADVVVIDPGEFALPAQTLMPRLREMFPDARMVGYAASDSPVLARACLSQGFRAFLSKTAELATLKAAISAVRSGALFLDPRYADAIMPGLPRQSGPQARVLTEREAYVLKSVARGKSLKEIGYELALSSKTVETYKARGTSKLNISGRREIVEYAIKSGWV
ncbi:MAG: hypothetical protein RIR62_1339 [Pseudomonadota bacterium]|jgi:DNA-binding NarL/FixJ family response regulator